ncbi:hypothetical protein [Vibrio cyclitrophicus]|nr:hypothetical protein [Vibrio cyclitrophicus]
MPNPPTFEVQSSTQFFDLIVKPQYEDFIENNFPQYVEHISLHYTKT